MYNLIVFILLFTFLLIYLIYKNAFVNGKPHCNHFVSNVYLYLALSVSLCGTFLHIYNYLFNEKKDVYTLLDTYKAFQQINLIPAIIMSFVSIIILSSRPLFSKKGYIFNHFVWLLFIASISITLYPYFKSYEFSVVLQKSFIMTCILFIFMTTIVFLIPSLIKGTYKKVMLGLMIALFSIIITEFYLIVTNQYTKNIYSIVSYIVIILFSLFIVYDTSRLNHYATICMNSPNYPLVSTNLFLDILNIFVRFMGISK